MKQVWVVCYIDSTKIDRVESDLAKHPKYKDIEVYIPTVKILRKQFKGKHFFDYVPLLFNYGFFKVPAYFVPNHHFLAQMKKDIKCIYGWVKDPAKTVASRLVTQEEIEQAKLNPEGLATASEEEIANLIRVQDDCSIYSSKDIEALQPGRIITLEGYPFDGLTAEVIKVNTQKKEVEVKLLLEVHMKHVKVSFDNIFYTIYKGNNISTPMREQSLEEIQENRRNVNHIFARITHD